MIKMIKMSNQQRNIVTTKLDLNLHWRQQTKCECECMDGVQSCKHARLHLLLLDDFGTIASITWAEERELERHQTKQRLQLIPKNNTQTQTSEQIQYMTQGWKLLIWGAD
jgi:hypothetical protein